MPQDVHITQAQMLTYYGQHLSDISEYVNNCISQVRAELAVVRDNACTKLCEIKRQKSYVEQILCQHKNHFESLRAMYNFGVEDLSLIDSDFDKLKQDAKKLTSEAERLEALIDNMESQIQMLEDYSKSTAASIQDTISSAKSTIETHSMNINTYIGGV